MKPALKPPLSEALSLLLPTPEETLLLRVCLWTDEIACDAWRQWHNPANGSGKALLENPTVRKLRPLLFKAVQSYKLDVDKEALTYLRTAYLKEELRSGAYRRICGEVLLILEKEGLSPIVLKGAALAETVYPDPVLRHCHDIDLLLPEAGMCRAARSMESLGFRASGANEAGHFKMVHELNLPLEFHSRLFEVPHYNVPEMCLSLVTREIAGVSAQTLNPIDSLLHVCGHAAYSSKRQSLRWVADAWFIVKRHPELDWDFLLDGIRRRRLALPLSFMLRYLAGSMNAAIPSAFLERLCKAASNSQPIERQLALRGTRSAGQGSLKDLFKRTTNWRDRALLIQWLLFPSPRYLSWVDQIHRPWILPFHYVYRPLRYLASSLRCKLWSFLRARNFA